LSYARIREARNMQARLGLSRGKLGLGD